MNSSDKRSFRESCDIAEKLLYDVVNTVAHVPYAIYRVLGMKEERAMKAAKATYTAAIIATVAFTGFKITDGIIKSNSKSPPIHLKAEKSDATFR